MKVYLAQLKLTAHIPEYIPGNFVLLCSPFFVPFKSLLSHRSGFHSQASSPQTSCNRLAPEIETHIVVPFGTLIFKICVSSVSRMGLLSGSVVDWRALLQSEFRSS